MRNVSSRRIHDNIFSEQYCYKRESTSYLYLNSTWLVWCEVRDAYLDLPVALSAFDVASTSVMPQVRRRQTPISFLQKLSDGTESTSLTG
ncbi:unnamed protein product [Protopolystoma xenopodis]|uniref:Uncharacterized protein n=1 Tax=Protopolystoma xenopodis TaxID=117903 RepID=A0A448WSX5_9PLAT|nr:unnamed protein product [Protopolystoma xenopodis]